MSSPAPVQERGTRVAWVDNLRVAAITGVIVVHAATAYVTDFADWYYDDELDPSAVGLALFGIPAFIGAIVGLGPLFWLAGWFSVGSLRRRGPAGFARSRLARLGLPLVAFLLLVNPGADVVGDLRDDRRGFVDLIGETEFGITWFVLALVVATGGYAVVRAVRPERAHAAPGPAAFALAAGLVAALGVAVWPMSSLLDGHLMSARPGAWAQGVALFALGAMAGEAADPAASVDAGLTRRGERLCGWLTIAGVLAILGVVILSEDDGSIEEALHEMPWEGVAFAVGYGLVSVTFTLWSLAWFGRRWTGQRRWTRPAGRASYATYLLHPLVLTSVMVGLWWLPLAAPAKLVVVALIAVPLCFLTGDAATRAPGLRRIL